MHVNILLEKGKSISPIGMHKLNTNGSALGNPGTTGFGGVLRKDDGS